MTDETPNVDVAYALKTTEDRKRLYDAWAATYDDGFAAATDYIYPQHVADVYHRRGGTGPVLDAGAGTGLLAHAILQKGNPVIDAIDLSAEMLAVARDKGFYRHLMEADLTQALPCQAETYASVVSSGTFTHGHVGPEALDELMRVAAPDALFVLSIKTELYKAQGFEAKLEIFESAIRAFELDEVPVYGAGADAEHAGETGLIASFRKG